MEIDMAAPGFERIASPAAEVDLIAQMGGFGEGPAWNRRTGEIYWVSIVGNTIWKFKRGVGLDVAMRPSFKANGMTFDREGRLVVAGWSWRRVWRREHDGSITTLCSHYDGKKINGPNDIVVKSDGSIWFTDPSGGLHLVEMYGEDVQRYLDFHGVFRISPDGKTSLVIEDCNYPNGLAFSPDETLLYVNDTRDFLIRVFDVQPDGSVRNGRLFYKAVGTESGMPDGMKCDVEGNVYCTGPGGVHVISPMGKLLGRIRIPGHVTNFAFGDDDWKGLYMTTYTQLLRTRVGVPGVAVG